LGRSGLDARYAPWPNISKRIRSSGSRIRKAKPKCCKAKEKIDRNRYPIVRESVVDALVTFSSIRHRPAALLSFPWPLFQLHNIFTRVLHPTLAAVARHKSMAAAVASMSPFLPSGTLDRGVSAPDTRDAPKLPNFTANLQQGLNNLVANPITFVEAEDANPTIQPTPNMIVLDDAVLKPLPDALAVSQSVGLFRACPCGIY
jgi:hypothetical protein